MTEDDREPTAQEFIRQTELAHRVGVCVRTIQRLRKRGVFPPGIFVYVGSTRLIRVDYAAFMVWLKDFKGEFRDPAPRKAPQPKPDEPQGPRMTLLR